MPDPVSRTASILIATHNRAHWLRECLASFDWPALEALGVEVLVCADGCHDSTVSLVREEFPGARLLVNEERRNLAYSRNALSHAARGELLVYLDDDAVPHPDWIAVLLQKAAPGTLMGGLIVDYEGDRPQNGPQRATFLGKRLPCAPDRANVGTGCNLAVPAACFKAIGGFDEELPYYFDDSDFCIRAARAGFHFRFVPEAVVRHRGSATKRGEAIRLQERHSTYAMLKAYRGAWGKWLLFSLLNGLWMAARWCWWMLQFRFRDSARLLGGWLDAYARFWGFQAPQG